MLSNREQANYAGAMRPGSLVVYPVKPIDPLPWSPRHDLLSVYSYYAHYHRWCTRASLQPTNSAPRDVGFFLVGISYEPRRGLEPVRQSVCRGAVSASGCRQVGCLRLMRFVCGEVVLELGGSRPKGIGE